MEKYRIISVSNNKLLCVHFEIQRKFLFWWLTIEKSENNKRTSLHFSSFDDAEDYMVQHYLTDGGDVVRVSKNEYHYKHWVYPGY